MCRGLRNERASIPKGAHIEALPVLRQPPLSDGALFQSPQLEKRDLLPELTARRRVGPEGQTWLRGGNDMSADLETASRYRKRAVGLRNIASDKAASEIRNQLLQIADDYERLAAILDDVDATDAALENRQHRLS